MKVEELEKLVQEIVKKSTELKDKHTVEKDAKINYACIFTQSKEEYDLSLQATQKLGSAIKKTPTGLLFKIKPLKTVSGQLQLLKIRAPDKTRPERGDADFTVRDYLSFKKNVLRKHGFKLIERKRFEMIELLDPEFDIRAYFSHPPIDKQIGLV